MWARAKYVGSWNEIPLHPWIVATLQYCFNIYDLFVHYPRGHFSSKSLQRRHNERDGVSNHQPHDCFLNHLFRRRSKKTSKLSATGLCAGNSPVTVNSPHKWPVTRKMFPFDDVIIMIMIATLKLASIWVYVVSSTAVQRSDFVVTHCTMHVLTSGMLCKITPCDIEIISNISQEIRTPAVSAFSCFIVIWCRLILLTIAQGPI